MLELDLIIEKGLLPSLFIWLWLTIKKESRAETCWALTGNSWSRFFCQTTLLVMSHDAMVTTHKQGNCQAPGRHNDANPIENKPSYIHSRGPGQHRFSIAWKFVGICLPRFSIKWSKCLRRKCTSMLMQRSCCIKVAGSKIPVQLAQHNHQSFYYLLLYLHSKFMSPEI